MSTFRVTVTATATTTYTVDVAGDDAGEAENMACASNIYAQESSEEFQVPHNSCSFETESEQLTAECPACGKDHPVAVSGGDVRLCYCGQFGYNPYPSEFTDFGSWKTRRPLRPHIILDGVCTPPPWWHEDSEYCAECGAKIEAEEAEEEAAR